MPAGLFLLIAIHRYLFTRSLVRPAILTDQIFSSLANAAYMTFCPASSKLTVTL